MDIQEMEEFSGMKLLDAIPNGGESTVEMLMCPEHPPVQYISVLLYQSISTKLNGK